MNESSYMRQALDEARKALGRTHPNPVVGAVLVRGGRVVATGYHARAGAPHAEAVVLAKAGARAKGATLYSTLEPCNHHGRTPPCTEAIIAAGVARVVYASADPNPLVNGRGHRRLLEAGVEVERGLLREDADALNRPFFKAVTAGLPWVTLKAGVTLDGKLAAADGRSKWITSDVARARAHRLRDEVDVVAVGVGTVLRDDPLLTARIPEGRNPVRLILDSALRTPPRAKILDVSEARTIVATVTSVEHRRARALLRRGVEVWPLPARGGRVALRPLLKRLVAEGLLHLLVEGGAQVHASFLSQRLADAVTLFVAPKLFGHGGLTWSGDLGRRGPGSHVALRGLTAEPLGEDLLLQGLIAQAP